MDLNNVNLPGLGARISAIEQSGATDMKQDVEGLGDQVGVDILKDLIGILGKDGSIDKKDINILKLFLELLSQLDDKEGGAKDAMSKALEGGGLASVPPATGGPAGSQAPPVNGGSNGVPPGKDGSGSDGKSPGSSVGDGGKPETAPGNAQPASGGTSPTASDAVGKEGAASTTSGKDKADCENCDPVDAKEVDTKPSDTKPIETTSGDANDTETKPAATKGAEGESSDTKPVSDPAPKQEAPEPEAPKPVSSEPGAQKTYDALNDSARSNGSVSSNEQKALDMFAKAFDVKPQAPTDFTSVLRQMLDSALKNGGISENEAKALSGIIGAMGGKADLNDGELQGMLSKAFDGMNVDGNISGVDLKAFGDLLSLKDGGQATAGATAPGSSAPTTAPKYGGLDYLSPDVLQRLFTPMAVNFAAFPGASATGDMYGALGLGGAGLGTGLDGSDESEDLI